MKKNPVVHFEMPYEDVKRLSDFYSKVFGWEMKQFGEEMGNYVLATTTETDSNQMVQIPGTINGGFVLKSDKNPHPSVVIDVDNIDDAIQRVKDAGGKALGEPMDIPGIGRYANFIDTEGNLVSMIQPNEKMT